MNHKYNNVLFTAQESCVSSWSDWVELSISFPCSKEPTLDPIMRKFGLVYKFTSYFFEIYFNIVFHSTHRYIKLSFLLGFLIKRSMHFLFPLTFYISSPPYPLLYWPPYSCFMKTANHYGVLFALFLPSISYIRTRIVPMFVTGHDSCFVIYLQHFRFSQQWVMLLRSQTL